MPTAHANSPSTGEAAGTDDASDNPPEPGGPLRRSPAADAHHENPIDVIWAWPGRCTVDLDWINSKLTAVRAEIARPVARLAVRIVGDTEMSRLHEAHAGSPGTTDVLTFDSSDPGGPIDADIAVCIDEAARQSREHGHAAERELLLYAVHGLLHCLGFDDHDHRSYERMHAEEDRLLEAIGVERTFAPQRGRSINKAE